MLTGETGAGKSILLDAFSLALGARGDASLVRHGAAQGQVSAVFDVPRNHPARAILAENALDDDGDIILRRVQTADGRTRVFVNDQPSSVTLMRDIGRALVEIHGQHDERALVDASRPSRPARRLRRPCRRGRGCGAAWRLWRDAEQQLAQHRARVEAAAREADYLRASVAELVRLDPQPGEETELADIRAAMMKAEKVAAEIKDAQDVLSGPEFAAAAACEPFRRLQRKSAEAPDLLDDVVTSLDEALISLDAAQSGVEAALRATEFDPQATGTGRGAAFCAARRVAQIRRSRRRPRAGPRDPMAADLADLDAGEEKLACAREGRRPPPATPMTGTAARLLGAARCCGASR